MSRKNYRKRRVTEESDDEEENSDKSVRSVIEETREIQMFRKRPKGVDAVGLAFGATKSSESGVIASDPFKSGGLVEMKSIKDRDRDRTGEGKDIDVTNLGNNFSVETNVRDEDVEMLKYIDDELAKRKGQDKETSERRKSTSKEDLLYAVPDNINVKSKIMKSEEMLSNQMLSGIPEVDLGIDAKIKNIEATEGAKLKQREESRKKKTVTSEFVPTNIAANFMHHNRFFDEQKALEKEKRKEREKKQQEELTVKPRGPVVGVDLVENVTEYENVGSSSTGKNDKKKSGQASDDFIYEKFRKRTRDSWRYQ